MSTISFRIHRFSFFLTKDDLFPRINQNEYQIFENWQNDNKEHWLFRWNSLCVWVSSYFNQNLYDWCLVFRKSIDHWSLLLHCCIGFLDSFQLFYLENSSHRSVWSINEKFFPFFQTEPNKSIRQEKTKRMTTKQKSFNHFNLICKKKSFSQKYRTGNQKQKNQMTSFSNEKHQPKNRPTESTGMDADFNQKNGNLSNLEIIFIFFLFAATETKTSTTAPTNQNGQR